MKGFKQYKNKERETVLAVKYFFDIFMINHLMSCFLSVHSSNSFFTSKDFRSEQVMYRSCDGLIIKTSLTEPI